MGFFFIYTSSFHKCDVSLRAVPDTAIGLSDMHIHCSLPGDVVALNYHAAVAVFGDYLVAEINAHFSAPP
jgi:hypothetical protein